MDVEILLYIFIFVGNPLICFSVCKSTMMRFLISSIFGIFIIAGRMRFLEAKSQDSDFDLIFLLSVIAWSVLVCVLYVIYLAIMVIVKRLFSKE